MASLKFTARNYSRCFIYISFVNTTYRKIKPNKIPSSFLRWEITLYIYSQKKNQNEEVEYSDRAKQTNNSWWMTLKKEERLRTRLPVRQTPVYSLHCCCCYIPEKDDDYYYMNVWQPARRRERRTEITSTTHHLLDKTICRFIYST